jgi:hypothetical protein
MSHCCWPDDAAQSFVVIFLLLDTTGKDCAVYSKAFRLAAHGLYSKVTGLPELMPMFLWGEIEVIDSLNFLARSIYNEVPFDFITPNLI